MSITKTICPYFDKNIENFGVIMKGKSLENLPKISENFESGFIINNFDLEFDKYSPFLRNKKIVHFVNKLFTAHMKFKNYKSLKIENIQMSSNFFFSLRLIRVWWRYKIMGLKVYFMDKNFNNKSSYFNNFFEGKFKEKFPNAGVLALCYVLEVIKPKNLWICGLDFYSNDYIHRRAHQTPLELQQKKMKESNLPEITMKIFSLYPQTNIYLYSYHPSLDVPENVKLLK